jgi:hypothetical protein
MYEKMGFGNVLLFQSLLILAIGGIIKSITGEFSPYYGYFVGIPDFIFAIFAIIALVLNYRKELSKRVYYAIMIYGILVIIPVGMILINTGLPGPLFIYDGNPGISTIFEFPMALAPTVVVPLFIIVSAVVLAIEFGLIKKDK